MRALFIGLAVVFTGIGLTMVSVGLLTGDPTGLVGVPVVALGIVRLVVEHHRGSRWTSRRRAASRKSGGPRRGR